MSITRRKLAPYAKQFVQNDPELPLAFLYFGPAAWDGRKELNNRTIILPPHENPSHYDWRVLNSQWVISYALGDTDTAYRERLAVELLLAGAVMVHMFLPARTIQVDNHIKYEALVNPHERYFRD